MELGKIMTCSASIVVLTYLWVWSSNQSPLWCLLGIVCTVVVSWQWRHWLLVATVFTAPLFVTISMFCFHDHSSCWVKQCVLPAPLALLVFVRLNMDVLCNNAISPHFSCWSQRAPHNSTFFDENSTSRMVIAKVDASLFPNDFVVVTGSCGSCNNHFLTIISRTFFVSSKAQHERQASIILFFRTCTNSSLSSD